MGPSITAAVLWNEHSFVSNSHSHTASAAVSAEVPDNGQHKQVLKVWGHLWNNLPTPPPHTHVHHTHSPYTHTLYTHTLLLTHSNTLWIMTEGRDWDYLPFTLHVSVLLMTSICKMFCRHPHHGWPLSLWVWVIALPLFLSCSSFQSSPPSVPVFLCPWVNVTPPQYYGSVLLHIRQKKECCSMRNIPRQPPSFIFLVSFFILSACILSAFF